MNIYKTMNDKQVEVISWYEGGELVRQTVNGLGIPIHIKLTPDVVMEESILSTEEFEKRFRQ